MLTPEDWTILRKSSILRDLPEADLSALVGERSVRSIERGHVLFQQGDPARAFFLVLGGQVKLSRVNPGGDEAVVHIYGAGESFAEAAMFLGGRYPVAAEAVVPSRVIHIESDALRRQVAERPEIAFAMMASLSRHLKVLVDPIEKMDLLSADRRVAGFLLGLCGEKKGTVTLSLPHEKNLIAKRLGMKPATFSRAVARIRELGVEVTGNKASIRDTPVVLAFVPARPKDELHAREVTPMFDTIRMQQASWSSWPNASAKSVRIAREAAPIAPAAVPRVLQSPSGKELHLLNRM